MISWLRHVVRSFGNLFAAMLRDPVWAIIALVTAPFRAWKHIVMLLVVTLGTGFIVSLLAMWIDHIVSPHAKNLLLENSLAVVSLIITLAVFLRLAFAPLIRHFGYDNGMSDTHGSARFGNKAEAMPLVRAKTGLLIGRGGDLGLLRYDGPSHLLTMAPTRTGKGVGTIIPNLLTQGRSIICIDPKGENAKITARARRMFGQVHILDPFGIHLTGSPDEFKALLQTMARQDACGGLVRRAANRHLAKSDREAAGVLSSAQRHTHFLDSPRMTNVLSHSDFAFGDLKSKPATVFLVLPPDRLATYSRWLRLLITQSLSDMARTPALPQSPVLYLLDEFAALGHLAPVERAMGLMAGYGVQLWPILQDIHQLKATYGQRAGTFLSNAGVLQVFGVNDHESAKLVSDLLGQQTVVFRAMSQTLDAEGSGISYAEQHTGRPLLTPDEVRNMPDDAALLFIAD